jgi:hypothetical protein
MLSSRARESIDFSPVKNRSVSSTQRWIGSPAIAALLGIALVVLASSCGQSTSSAKLPTPSAAPSPPPGGPVPIKLLGGWYVMPADINAIVGYTACQLPSTPAKCSVQIVFTTTTVTWPNNLGFPSCCGDVVVSNSEVDFFNDSGCGIPLPDGLGRYMWTLTGSVLHFTPLNQDPCDRSAWLANRNFYRTS